MLVEKTSPPPAEVGGYDLGSSGLSFRGKTGILNPLSPDDTEFVPTIMGEAKRSNSYNVDTMTRAYNLIYGEQPSQLPITHRYAKFTPSTLAQIRTLFESDLTIVDFPLHREVIQMEDYYLPDGGAGSSGGPGQTGNNGVSYQGIGEHDPLPGIVPEYYTVLEYDQEIPAVPHTVLDELVLAPYVSLLTYVAFRISGEEHEGLPEIGTPSVNAGGPDYEDCEDTCPEDFLCCLFEEGISCAESIPTFCVMATWDCNPWQYIGNGVWPECLLINGSEENDDDPPLPSGCTCLSWPNRNPAGCVRVEDTHLPVNSFTEGQNRHMQGVDGVKITWYNGWFSFATTWTDENGCWRIDREEHGKAYMWVTFQNDQLGVRSTLGNTVNIFLFFFPHRDFVGEIGGGTYYNIEVNYLMWAVPGSRAQRRWGASNVMNGLQEYRQRASADNMTLPPNILDVLINHGEGSSAPMLDHLYGADILDIIDAGFDEINFGNIIGDAFELSFENAAWDVLISVDEGNSDDLYETIFHEFAHASHFAQVGSNFWSELIVFEILAGGWGTENSLGAPLIALCESWAEHIGESYTHDRYGAANSGGGPTDTWQTELEETRNNTPNHVPIGLYHDLIDDVPDVNPACEDNDGTSCGPIVDNVSGFSNGEMFSLLTPFIDNVDLFRLSVENNLLPGSGNTLADLDALFDSY